MIWPDLKHSLRSLLRSPGLALTTVVTIAIAVGMATSVFSVVDAVLLRPLPYRDAGRLATISTAERTDKHGPVSFDDFQDWMRNSRTFESGALYSAFYKPILTGVGNAELLSTYVVSHDYFTVMGVQPRLGRFFRVEEDRDGPDDVVVLSFDTWRAKFHSDEHVVGRTIMLNARPQTIVGVAGPDLHPLPAALAPDPPQIYRALGESYGPGSRDGRHLRTLVRLRPGVSVEQAQAELDVRCRHMQKEHDADKHLAAILRSLRQDVSRNSKSALLALQGAVLMLLLIACANIANLLLAKSSSRRRELAIRAALGAGTARLARMLMTESLVLGLAGGFCGVLLAIWGIAGMEAIAARVLPEAESVSVNARVLAFSFVLSVGCSVVFGIAPVFRLREAGESALQSGSRLLGDHRNRLRQVLAAAQIALSLVLLVCTGLLGKSFLRLRSVDPGFNPTGILSASVSIPRPRYPTEAAVAQFFHRVLNRLDARPEIAGATVASIVPMSGDYDRTGFEIAGQNFSARDREYPDRNIVSPGYFQTLRIPLRQGRSFTDGDDAQHPPVCIISESAARLWFPGESPLGKRIRAGAENGEFSKSPYREVVGVVGDVAQYRLDLPPTPQIYMPHAQFATRFLSFLVRTNGDPATLIGTLRDVVRGVDAEVPLYDVRPLEQIVANTVAARRFGLWLLIVFAGTALMLAGIGIYGVVSYSVARRTTEFGVRMALGARPVDILRTTMRDSLPMIIAGLTIGIALSLSASRLLASFLFGVSATDATAFALLPCLLAIIALAACYVPALRAARLDPVSALRVE